MFDQIKAAVLAQATTMQASGAMFQAQINRDNIWLTYINAFPEATRQEHNCNCCKSFIRQYGGTVTFDANLNPITVWDVEAPEEYAASIKALSEYIKSCKIESIYLNDGKSVGTDKNLDSKRNIIWKHFQVPIQTKYIAKADQIATLKGSHRSSKDVFLRGLTEIKDDALQTVLELIGQNSLYRGKEYEHIIKGFQKLKASFKDVPSDKQDAWAWVESTKQENKPVMHAKNTAIGTLLMDLSEGKELEHAVSAFEKIMAPSNYKRPTALVTPRMIDDAKKTIEEAGMIGALSRRKLDTRDLKANQALYVFRPKKATMDVFDQLKGDAKVDIQSLSKVEEVSIENFIEKILPSAQSLRMLVEPRHTGNFVTLTGPRNEGEPSIMKWNNSYGWSYTGGNADSIKERVKKAGGKVDGWMRISLGWHNHDDLDLHFKSKNSHVYFGNKRGSVCWLDVDANSPGSRHTREPVENISFPKQLAAGSYEIRINQYSRRESTGDGFEIEFEVNGETHTFSSDKNPRGGSDKIIKFTIAADGSIQFAETDLSKSGASILKWNIQTNSWQDVLAVTNSPNHWEKPVGNLHRFFILRGCKSDEQTKPFYNEFLCDLLNEKRKVMEVLSSKIEIDEADGQELSGLGFSDTMRNHAFFEVEGAFKRVIKVTF